MNAQPEHILVVDDDEGLRELLERYLTEQGFRVTAVADGVAMRRVLAEHMPDLIILDLMLPGEDGLSLAREVRRGLDVPIIMLSARGEEIDRIVGLEVGADDYLPKPCNPRELLARIRAVLRRRVAAPAGTDSAAAEADVRTFGPYRLDLATRTLAREGHPLPLTHGEFLLLRVFAENPNRVLSRDTLVDLIKGYDRSPFDRSIDVRVARLRRKIEPDPNAPRYIRTAWGAGYLFTPKGEAP
jgi:DNA-binding response OmpR family regulator